MSTGMKRNCNRYKVQENKYDIGFQTDPMGKLVFRLSLTHIIYVIFRGMKVERMCVCVKLVLSTSAL